MSRNHQQWLRKPPFPESHFVDAAIYTSDAIFAEEQEKVFRSSWIIACHESEIPEAYDYRTFRHPSGENLIIVRGADNQVRAFFNICPHRGNTIVYEPSGNAKRMTCIFHAWSFDSTGACVDIPRGTEGYQERLSPDDVHLREVRCEVGFGGMVWVNVDDEAMSLREYIGDALYLLEMCLLPPMEVFHYHKAIVKTNYKLWHDTNSEFYHDFMHYFNRVTGMLQPGYYDRKYTGYANGHASVGSMEVKYDAYEGGHQRGVGWPGLAPGGWVLVDLFPGITFNLRTSVLRIDTAIPLGPNELMIEYRGLGLKSDTPAQRAERVRDHNSIWGPFGRNLHEDLLGVHGQGLAMHGDRSGAKWILHGREENATIHDELGMRHFYAEWSKRMGRKAAAPFGDAGGRVA